MEKPKFGFSQRKLPTPKKKADLFDFLGGICSILAGFVVTAKFIPQHVSDIISPILSALFVPLFIYLKKWWGQEPSNDESQS